MRCFKKWWSFISASIRQEQSFQADIRTIAYVIPCRTQSAKTKFNASCNEIQIYSEKTWTMYSNLHPVKSNKLQKPAK